MDFPYDWERLNLSALSALLGDADACFEMLKDMERAVLAFDGYSEEQQAFYAQVFRRLEPLPPPSQHTPDEHLVEQALGLRPIQGQSKSLATRNVKIAIEVTGYQLRLGISREKAVDKFMEDEETCNQLAKGLGFDRIFEIAKDNVHTALAHYHAEPLKRGRKRR